MTVSEAIDELCHRRNMQEDALMFEKNPVVKQLMGEGIDKLNRNIEILRDAEVILNELNKGR